MHMFLLKQYSIEKKDLTAGAMLMISHIHAHIGRAYITFICLGHSPKLSCHPATSCNKILFCIVFSDRL